MYDFRKLKKFLIVNSGSGKGYALHIFYTILMPHLHSNISYIYICEKDGILSNSYEHLCELFRSTEYDIIIVLGGDGTVNVTVNAMIECKLNKSICHLPCGTGNGLSKSVHYTMYRKLYINNQYKSFNIDTAITNMKKYKTCSVNLFEVICPNTHFNTHGFLSLTWGIFSNIDIKTEWLRCIGSFRNTLGALWELYRKNSYYGSLSYKNESGEWITIGDHFYYFTASNVSHICHDVFISPDIKLNDGYFHIGFLRGKTSRYNIAKLLLSFNTGTCDKYLEIIKTSHFKLKISSGFVVLDGEQIDHVFREFEVKMLDKQLTLF